MNKEAAFIIEFEYIECVATTLNGSLKVKSYQSKSMRGELAKNYELLYMEVLCEIMERTLVDDAIPIKCLGYIIEDHIPAWLVGNRQYNLIRDRFPKRLPFHRERIYNFDNPKVVQDIKDKAKRDIRKIEYYQGESLKQYPFDISIITGELDNIMYSHLIMKKDYRWIPAGLIEYKTPQTLKDHSQEEEDKFKEGIKESDKIRKEQLYQDHMQRYQREIDAENKPPRVIL